MLSLTWYSAPLEQAQDNLEINLDGIKRKVSVLDPANIHGIPPISARIITCPA